MVCPECGSEYREGFTRCGDCDVDLVVPAAPEPEANLVKVWESSNAALRPLYESLLRAANIEFLVRGEAIQGLFEGANYAFGPVEFWVREESGEEARAIAESLESSEELPASEELPGSEEPPAEP